MSTTGPKVPYRILVIDGDSLFRGLIASILRERYIVSTAGDHFEAMYDMIEQVPDVVMIGVESLRSSDLKNVRDLRHHPRLGRARLVVLTAAANRSAVSAAIRAGADDYIDKATISREILDETLDGLLSFARENRPVEPRRHNASIVNQSPNPHRNAIAIRRPAGGVTSRVVR